MKAITILQPWAELVIAGTKRIENRTWRTSHRGPLVVHAGKSPRLYDVDVERWEEFYGVRMPRVNEVDYGAVVGVVEVVDCLRRAEAEGKYPDLAGPMMEGPWCWVLRGATRCRVVKVMGRQMLWEYGGEILATQVEAGDGAAGKLPKSGGNVLY